MCFDVTNCGTLDSVPDWIELAQKERYGRIKKPLIVLVGNKVDEQNQREVSTKHDGEIKNLMFGGVYVESVPFSQKYDVFCYCFAFFFSPAFCCNQ